MVILCFRHAYFSLWLCAVVGLLYPFSFDCCLFCIGHCFKVFFNMIPGGFLVKAHWLRPDIKVTHICGFDGFGIRRTKDADSQSFQPCGCFHQIVPQAKSNNHLKNVFFLLGWYYFEMQQKYCFKKHFFCLVCCYLMIQLKKNKRLLYFELCWSVTFIN